MMKVRNVILIFLVGLILGIVGTNAYYMFLGNNTKKNSNNVNSLDYIDTSSVDYLMSEKLFEYGNLIYDSKGYKKYQKVNGAYFVNLNDLQSDFNYDISMFVNADGTYCDKDKTGLYFDVDKVMSKYEANVNPILINLVDCGNLVNTK